MTASLSGRGERGDFATRAASPFSPVMVSTEPSSTVTCCRSGITLLGDGRVGGLQLRELRFERLFSGEELHDNGMGLLNPPTHARVLEEELQQRLLAAEAGYEVALGGFGAEEGLAAHGIIVHQDALAFHGGAELDADQVHAALDLVGLGL